MEDAAREAIIDNDVARLTDLLSLGLDPSDRPLSLAVTYGRVGMVRLMLAWGASPNTPNDYNNPLMYAIFHHQVDMVRELLQHRDLRLMIDCGLPAHPDPALFFTVMYAHDDEVEGLVERRTSLAELLRAHDLTAGMPDGYVRRAERFLLECIRRRQRTMAALLAGGGPADAAAFSSLRDVIHGRY